MCTFRVEQHVAADNVQAMLEAFFRDRLVTGVLHRLTGLRVLSPDRVRVHWQQMGTKAVSMSFLNKFEECGAIGASGHIRGRKEFLFRIFSHLIFGGASNQYEDHVEEYFNVTKAVYKDLLTVRRNDAGDVEVLSTVA